MKQILDQERPVRILHVYKDYPPIIGGIEGHLCRLAEAQARRGLDVTVLVTAPDRRTRDEYLNGVRVVRAGRIAKLASTPLSASLPLWLHRLEADVVHLHFPYPLGEMAHLLSGRRRPAVITYHSDIVRQRLLGLLYRPIARLLLRRAHCILLTSSVYGASSSLLAEHRDRCRIVPLGIDPTPYQTAAPAELGPDPVVLFVGRLRYYKGLPILVRAMEQVPARLVIVGRGEMETPLRQLLRRSPAKERIALLGDISDDLLPGLYARADVFVLPSTARSEAFGQVLLEAMAAGTPVVSTELGTGTSFVNRHGETGLVVAPGDADALAEALRTLLDDDELRRRLGRAARARVRTEFHLDDMVETIVEIYREALAPGDGGSRRLA